MNRAWLIVFAIVFVFLGGVQIADAVKDFKNGYYYRFGVDILLALMAATVVCKTTAIMWSI